MPRTAHSRAGFTMVEILAVVIIFGVLAAVAVPKVQGIMRTSKVNAAASTIAGDVEHAFSLAARSRRPVRLTCYPLERRYTIAARATPLEPMVTRYFGPDGEWSLDSSECSANTVDFFPNGLASGPWSVTARTGTTGRIIAMSRAGKVRITVQ